ncbi:uncharacterized protein LOC133171874 [Saccostrea echinata]|uniref:uncharacterized protein LOC133171874 n=1 Tax=Saccostrea echinata TaxID=191078 RepID=UPI002A82F107|nr:uncharacterized protein LOC133171874 [Saccostrea echinata]
MDDVIDLYIVPLLMKYINRWTSKEDIPKARPLGCETNRTKPTPKGVDLNDRDSYDVVIEVGMKDGKPYTKDAYRIDRASGLGYNLSKEDMCPSSMFVKRAHCPDRVAFPKDVYFTQAKIEKNTDYTYEMERRAKCPRTLDEYYSYNTESRRGRECYLHPDEDKETATVSNGKCCCTEDDHRRREAWNHYQMDYMGRDASDNIIQKIVNTINTRQYHPHTRKYDPRFLETFVGHHPYHYPSAEPPPPTFRIRKIIE